MDAELRRLKREAQADPGDAIAQARYRVAEARAHGREPLRLLLSVDDWDAADAAAQDAAIGATLLRLGEDYSLVRVAEYSEQVGGCERCDGTGQCTEKTHESCMGAGGMWDYDYETCYALESCKECSGTGGALGRVSHRIATFLHSPSGTELNLIPGNGRRGYLLARTVWTVGQARAWKKPNRKNGRAVWLAKADWIEEDYLKREFPGAPKRTDPRHALEELGLRWPDAFEWEHAAGLRHTIPRTDDARPCDCDDHPRAPDRPDARINAFGLVDMLGNACEVVQRFDEVQVVGAVCLPANPGRAGDYAVQVPAWARTWRPCRTVVDEEELARSA